MRARMLHHFPTSGNIVITGAEGATVPYHNIAREAVCSPLASLGMCKYCTCNSYFKAMYVQLHVRLQQYVLSFHCHFTTACSQNNSMVKSQM